MPSPRGLLADRRFRALWLSRTVSFLGDGVTRTALVLITARHGAGAVTLVLLAGTLPRLLGPVAGALADRWERRRLMRGCELGQAAVLAVIAATLPPVAVLAALVAVAAVLATAFGPASSSCVPDLVPPARLSRANALIGTALNVQLAIGPAVAGFLVGLGGGRVAFAVDAGTFVVSALLLGRLPVLPPGSSERVGNVWRASRDGLGYVWRTRALRAFVAGTIVFVAFAAIDNVALVFLVERRLGGSATAFGLVQACFGAGMLAASVGLGAARRVGGPRQLVLAGGGATVAGSLLTAVAPGLGWAGAAQGVAGLGNGVENVAVNTFVQRLVPAPMLGRAFGAINTAAQVGSGLAYVAGAPLVAGVGPRGAFAVAGVGALAGILLLSRGLRRA